MAEIKEDLRAKNIKAIVDEQLKVFSMFFASVRFILFITVGGRTVASCPFSIPGLSLDLGFSMEEEAAISIPAIARFGKIQTFFCFVACVNRGFLTHFKFIMDESALT